MDKADLMLVVKEFSKEELLALSTELGLKVKETARSVDIVQALVSDLEENGIPEDDDINDLMGDFLRVTGFIESDEDEDEDEESDENDDKQVDNGNDDDGEVEGGDEQRFPVCFGYADDRQGGDPACRKCAVFSLCLDKRTTMRPACFGILFDKNNEDCMGCLEATNCSKIVQSK